MAMHDRRTEKLLLATWEKVSARYAPVPHSALPSLQSPCLTALYVVMATPSIYITTPVKVILDQV